MKRKHLLTLVFISMLAACTKDNTEVTPTDKRDKFVGNWLCNEGSGTPFTIVISKSGSNDLNIKNFSNYGDHGNAKCEMSGDNTFVISAQDFNDLPNVEDTVSAGFGTYSKTGTQEKIKMGYKVNGVDYNNVTCTK